MAALKNNYKKLGECSLVLNHAKQGIVDDISRSRLAVFLNKGEIQPHK